MMRRIFTHFKRSPKARKILAAVECSPGRCAAEIDQLADTVGAIDYLNTLWLDNKVTFDVRPSSPFHPQGIKHWSACA